MSRRRYLSTEISTDTAINRLARTAGDFAVMLYTWMIPHADDDGIVHGDAEEIILKVIPGRRDKKIEDVTAALAAMQELELIEWDENARCVIFPYSSFYKYQTYIKPERRRGAEQNNAPEMPQDSENSADQRKTPQNVASLKHSLSHPVKHSPSHSLDEQPAVAAQPRPKRTGGKIPDDFEITPELRAVAIAAGVPAEQIAFQTEQWRDHHTAKGDVVRDAAASWRTWMRNAPGFNHGRASPNGNGHPPRATRIDAADRFTVNGKEPTDERKQHVEEVARIAIARREAEAANGGGD